MTSIQLNHIKKAYGETVIMEDMDFQINEGERLVLLGPSGCGKSTILRMIAGFEEVSGGELKFGDKVMNDVEPGHRNVAMVFQNYALYPHMTVEENIMYGLKVNKVPLEKIQDRYDEVVEALNLTPYLDRKPSELSGGQRQRVALARATVKESSVFLLDEPLSNLDAQLRVSARESLMDIHDNYKQTMVYVTHDQIEAMTFGTRIALLNFGELQQIDTPENIYRKPANIFTAKFIGNPPMNVIENSYVDAGNVVIGSQKVRLAANWQDYLKNKEADNLWAGIRPESIRLHRTPKPNTFEGKLIHVEHQGATYANVVEVDGELVTALSKFRVAVKGDNVYLEFINDQLHFFDHTTTNNVGYPENILQKIEANTVGNRELFEMIEQDNANQQAEMVEANL
ncbi:ABC transporter ATP-binding protein [Aerococcus urinaeequi]|uniref:ABC transporter ATP-binding protein n=1 Tax=Aerococcus urinaeequi TaxID=51665 RepID=A0AA47GBI9_9LACT|nr:ABC transporter ATP-binding protein [Aerococcus urinaeequi]MCY7730135.1 ABC transporter ATP-binding protein [Aerococcus urinaeequi]MDT2762373.1 ABC transporter ATP-binding protein [Aerococcus urinaeequi]WAT24710.1 ABC transporter ATP-binding protein [Aerococcus urinaeequi]HJH01725.1 ABC transporter ATP-binding protein [Aerococcus urinaeequi]